MFLALALKLALLAVASPSAGLIDPISAVSGPNGQVYYCHDLATGANPSHPAYDPCNGVWDY